MAIEFDCPNCKQLVKTPDAAAGKKGRCPNCQSVVQIPTVSTPAAASRKPASNEAETKDLPIEADSPFEFACPSCGSTMRATAATVGKKGRCATCKNVVVIPSPSANQVAPSQQQPVRQEIDEDSLIARFHEQDDPAPAPAAPARPAYGSAMGPMAQPTPQSANPWAAWGQGARPAVPPQNPFLSALDDAAKSAPEVKLNPYATSAMVKAAEKGGQYNWDEDLDKRTGLPYENLKSESPFSETLREVLFNTDMAFRRMLVDRDVGKSVSYLTYGASILGVVFGALYALFFFALLAITLLAGKIEQEAMPIVIGTFMGMGIGFFVGFWGMMVLQSLFWVAVSSGVHHLALMVTGQLRRGFGTTFKVNAYVAGTCLPLCLIPCVNFAVGLIAPILLVVGIRRAHNISLGRAIGVVILPYVVFIGLYIFLIITVMALVPPPPTLPGR